MYSYEKLTMWHLLRFIFFVIKLNNNLLCINVSSSLTINREDFDCATSKGRGSHEAKQNLAEYASLYREYEHINKCIREGNCEPELENRKAELTKELAAREEHIRKVRQ